LAKRDRKYDFIVVGAGTAGCAVAARLSERGHRVLLLEAGGEARSVWTRIPAGYAKLLGDPRYDWMYRTQPEPALEGRVIDVPAGRTIGGTGAINGMIYIRGHPRDYDAWRDAGNPGWGYADVLPWFRRSEANVRGADAFHGAQGPMPVADARPDALSRAFVDAALEAGLARNADFNGPTQEGAGFYQLNLRAGQRASTATAYLASARKRPNLDVVSRALVHRVVFDGRRATGVDYSHAGRDERANGGEIVVCAGAFNSPQLLLRSGLGEPADLARLSIRCVHPLPGVGRNLQNHFRASLVMHCAAGLSLNERAQRWSGRIGMASAYLLARGGPLATGTTAGAFLRSDAQPGRPDLQLVFWNYSVATRDARGLKLHDFPGYTINVTILAPHSRGRVQLASADPSAAPLIAYNHLQDARDAVAVGAGLRLAREIASMRSLAVRSSGEVAPGEDVAGASALVDYARRRGSSVFHPVGSCRMGGDDLAVVDSRLRVHGVEGLRVADASVMPTIIAGNTNAATLMIAERACAWLVGDER